MAKKPDEKKDESGTEPLKPKLWFRNSVPYEHEVFGYDELHPTIQKQIDLIRAKTQLSRFDAAYWSAMAAILVNPNFIIPGGIITAASYNNAQKVRDGLNLKRNISELEIMQTMNDMHCFYVPAQNSTLELGKIINEIAKKGESPFKRTDAKEILNRYQYGIIDNEGNLVLLKHPQDESAKKLTGWQMLKKIFAWRQPFQRTRFEIQKPKIKERVKKPWFTPKLAPAGIRLALVPVRWRRSQF